MNPLPLKTLYMCKTLGRLPLQEGDGESFLTVFRSRPVLDESRARDVKFAQGIEFLVCDGMRRQIESRTHPGEHGGITSIGLGKVTVAFGKASRSQRIDLDQRQSGISQIPLKSAMVTTCRLEDYASNVVSYPVEHGTMPVPIIGKAALLARRQAMNVESVFRDINSNGNICHLFRVPCLSSEP